MARQIICTNADMEIIIKQIKESLKFGKFQNGKINISHNLPEIKENASLIFTNKAWLKILSLVMSFDKEVQWNGVVKRLSRNEFQIEDILVFPHEITSTTVTSNQKEYEDWLDKLDDETFNHLRLHGHSHVNMAVTPSTVDIEVRNNVIKTISTNDNEAYYIFIIVNKRHEISAEIYDIENNILYEKNDIKLIVKTDDNEYLNNFLADAKKVVTEPIRTYAYKNDKKKDNKFSSQHYVKLPFDDDLYRDC